VIQIFRSADGPALLTKRGVAQTVEDCRAYDRSPKAYRSGRNGFSSKRGIYASRQVKQTLLKSQYNKCCYCEKKFRSPIFLAVEHFRPKTGVRQSRKSPAECPGYYWLAYQWNNLLLSCHECNSTWKQVLFPLLNPRQRARSHHDNIKAERPVLINPLSENPRRHIQFRDDAPEAFTARGRRTIEILGLRRPALREDRLERLDILRSFSDLISLAKTTRNGQLKKLAREAQAFLDAAVLPEAEFSSMAQDFLSPP